MDPQGGTFLKVDPHSSVCILCSQPLDTDKCIVWLFDPEDVRFRGQERKEVAEHLITLQLTQSRFDGHTRFRKMHGGVVHADCFEKDRMEHGPLQRLKIRQLPHSYHLEQLDNVAMQKSELAQILEQDMETQEMFRRFLVETIDLQAPSYPEIDANPNENKQPLSEVVPAIIPNARFSDPGDEDTNPHRRAQNSPYLCLIQDVYSRIFVSLDVVPNEPWLSPSKNLTAQYDLIHAYADHDPQKLDRCKPPSYVLVLNLKDDAEEPFFQVHGSWDLSHFVNRIICYTVTGSLTKEELMVSMGVFKSRTGTLFAWWVFEEDETVHLRQRPDVSISATKASVRSYRVALFQKVPTDKLSLIAKPSSLRELADPHWLTAQRKKVLFEEEAQEVDRWIRQHHAGTSMEPNPDITTVSKCTFDPIGKELRVYINCSPDRLVYGATSPALVLYRYETCPDRMRYPVPVLVNVSSWKSGAGNTERLNGLIDSWNIADKSSRNKRAIPNPVKQ